MADVEIAYQAFPSPGPRPILGLEAPIRENRVKLRRSDHLCPNLQAALDILARPWSGLIMATLAKAGSLRFSALREQLAAMGDRMLSLRLKELETRGLVERRVSSGPPVKVDYALTELGRGFGDVSLALGRWGQRVNEAAAARREAPCAAPGRRGGERRAPGRPRRAAP
jgi:DNA-binding HxlR family transcriptional regulator